MTKEEFWEHTEKIFGKDFFNHADSMTTEDIKRRFMERLCTTETVTNTLIVLGG